jgi:restriction endonuclease S subunit
MSNDLVENENSNIYFLNNVIGIDNLFLYHILKYNEDNLNKLAKLTVTISLNRNNLENFEIPMIEEKLQKDIIKEINSFEEKIEELKKVNNIILSKKIIQDTINLIN